MEKNFLLKISEPSCLYNPNNCFYVLAVSNDGYQLAAGDFDGNVYLYQNLQLIKKFNFHSKYIITLQFSKSGKYLASGSADHKVGLVTISKMDFQVKTFLNNAAYIMKVGFSLNENYLITASSDKTLQIYNSFTNQKVKEITYFSALNYAEFLGSSQIILFGTIGQIEIRNFNQINRKIKTKPLNLFIKRASLCKKSEKQNLILVNGTKMSKTLILDLISFKQIRKINSSTEFEILDIHLSDSNLIITQSERIEIWNWVTGQLLGIIETSASVGSSMMTNDNRLFSISRSHIKIWTIHDSDLI